MIKAEWTNNDAISAEQTTQTNAPNTLNALDCISRQAAIDALEGEIEVIGKANAEAVLKYTKMVCDRIKALPSAQPEQSIAEWQKDFQEYINMLNIPRDDYKGIMEYINDVPSAQPEPRWIPVTEGPPKNNGRYLVTRGINAIGSLWNRVYIINYSDLMGLCKEKIWWTGNVGKSDFVKFEDVLAWMPLPKPYGRSEE